MKILTTLAEKHYFIGLAALVNSVVKNGPYVDKIIVGYRGTLPSWLPELKSSDRGKSAILKCGIELEFIEIVGDLHMVHEKPKWFLYLTEVLEPTAQEYFFFDSDIIIINRMSFFGEWVSEGIGLCEDVNYDMSATNPIRRKWARFAEEDGYTVNKSLERYYNSGFLSWTRGTAEFIKDWDKSFATLAKHSGDMKKMRVYDRTYPVFSTNQDSLNLAAMITNVPISSIGPEAMGFQYGLALMLHPMGVKPWKMKYLSSFIGGVPPRTSDLPFWENVNTPELKPYSDGVVRYKSILIRILRLFGRFYRRS